MIRRIALIAVAIAALGLVGCGSNDSLGLSAPLVVDLEPVQVAAPLSVVTSQAFDVEVTVKNNGGIDARGFTVQAEVFTGAFLLSAGSTTVETGLSAGDVVIPVIKMSGIPAFGAYTLVVTVDPTDNIAESDETNNQITTNITVSDLGGGTGEPIPIPIKRNG